MASSCASRERVGRPPSASPRTDRRRAEAPDRQVDRAQLGGVTVAAPDDHRGDAAELRLQHGQVADARLIGAAAVVDDQDFAGRSCVDGLQEDVDAAGMDDGTGRAYDRWPGHDGADVRRGDPEPQAQPDRSIGDRRGRDVSRHSPSPPAWSGRRDSNPQPRTPKARALPLRHAPTGLTLSNGTYLRLSAGKGAPLTRPMVRPRMAQTWSPRPGWNGARAPVTAASSDPAWDRHTWEGNRRSVALGRSS